MAERALTPTSPPPPAGAPGPYRPAPPWPADRSGPDEPSRAVGIRTGVASAAIILYFVGQLLAGLVIGVWFVASDGTTVGQDALVIEPALLLLAAVGGQVIGLAASLAFLRWRRIDLRAVLGATRPAPRLLLTGVGIGAGLLVVSTLVVAGLMWLTGSEQPAEQFLLEELSRGGVSTLLAVIAAVILAPVAEELLFRGLLFTALVRRRGLHAAAIISSLAFAVVHVDVAVSQPLALVGLTLVGLALAYAYQRSGSLLVPIAGHAAFNGITLVVALLGDRLVAGALILSWAAPVGW